MDWRVHLLLLGVVMATVTGVQQVTNPRIIEHPTDQYVAKNEPATLNCKAEGEPPPVITWYRDRTPVVTANENPLSTRMLLPSGQLFFLRIIHNKKDKPDVGVYYCNATNPETHVSVVSREAVLEIAAIRDDFRQTPRNTDVAVGDTAYLHCKGPKGQPDPRIKWKKDGETIALNSRVSIEAEGSLVIEDARKSDTGMYTCMATNIAGEKETPAARLSVLEKPILVVLPEDVERDAGSEASFSCEATGDPPPTIIWKRDHGQIPSQRSHIGKDRSLHIDNIKVSDEGDYVCRAENAVGYVEATATLSVHSQPSFIVTPKDKTVGVGRRVSFKCEVTGNPPPAVFWNRDTDQKMMFPRQDHGRFQVADDGTLIIEPVRKSDEGEYVCQVYSVAGSALAKARLEVKDVDPRPPPIIHQGPQNQTLPINSVAMLQCASSGEPMPAISWTRNARPLPPQDARFATLDSGTLQISDLREADTGIYTCKAVSETGETTWSAALVVEMPSNPNVIFHRTPEPSTFPGPPSMPQVKDVGETSMHLSWKANSNHGASPVFAYTVEYFSHETGDGWIVASDSINAQDYTVQHLRPDTAYMFLVRAQNSHGLSLPSSVTAPIRSLGGASGGARRPTMQQHEIDIVHEKLSGNVVQMKNPDVISSTAIKLNWEVKKSHRYIEGFHIKYREIPDPAASPYKHQHHADFTTETVSVPTASMYVLRNLHKYAWYEVRVQPFYLSVEGQESNTVRVRTFEDVPSLPPAAITWDLLTNDSLLLNWQPPPPASRHGPLRGYKVYLYGNESRFHRQLVTNATTTAVVVTDLVRGMPYRIQMAAFNKMGEGVKSDPTIVGGPNPEGMMQSLTRQPWFIATLIGTVGGTLWFALCVFSVWLYRKRKAKKKTNKNGVMSVPVHKSDDHARLGNYFGSLNAPNYLQKDIANHVTSMAPDVTNVSAADSKEDEYKENLYNTPGINPPPPPPAMKTFNKGGGAPVTPYATTTLLQNALMGGPPPPGAPLMGNGGESAFRPIQRGPGYPGMPPHGSGSSDSCQKQDLSSDSNNESHLNNSNYAAAGLQGSVTPRTTPMLGRRPTPRGTPMLPRRGPLPPHCEEHQQEPPQPGPGCHLLADTCEQCGEHLHSPVSECDSIMDDPRHPLMGLGGGGPVLFLPPPPDNPPPSDIGTPPDSPTRTNHYHHHGTAPGGGRYQPIPQPRGRHPGVYSDGHSLTNHRTPHHHHHHHHAPAPPPNKYPPGVGGDGYRTMSPRVSLGAGADRAYSPRAMSEPERGPTPPVRAYKLVPISAAATGTSSDTETPAPGMYHSPPSPAPEDNRHRGLEEEDEEEEEEEYVGESDLETQQGGDCDVDSNVAASWNSDPEVASSRTSLSSSDDGGFFAEADFASAVAKAAEMSGLTVVGSTISGDPNQKEKKYRKHRGERKQREPRPASPYSTDSNYSAVAAPAPRNPYPKSERKRQLQQGKRPPAVKAKPGAPAGVDYTKPGGGIYPPLGSGSLGQPRTNPMAAFDTSDTPIV